jgi:hypothetical protein
MRVADTTKDYHVTRIAHSADRALTIELDEAVKLFDEDAPYKTRKAALTQDQSRAHRRHVLNTFCSLEPEHIPINTLSEHPNDEYVWPEAASALGKASAEWKGMLNVDNNGRLTHSQQEHWSDQEQTTFEFPKGFEDYVIRLGGDHISYPRISVHSSVNNSGPKQHWPSSPVVASDHVESTGWYSDPVVKTSRRTANLSSELRSCSNQKLALTKAQLASAKPVFQQALAEIISKDGNRLSFLYDRMPNSEITNAMSKVAAQFIKNQGITCERQLLLNNVGELSDDISLDLPDSVTRPLTQDTFRERAYHILSQALEKLKAKPDDASNLKAAAEQVFSWVEEDLLPSQTKQLAANETIEHEFFSDIVADVVTELESARFGKLGKDTVVTFALVNVDDTDKESRRAGHKFWHRNPATSLGEVVSLDNPDKKDVSHLACTLTTPKEGEEDMVWTVGLDLDEYELRSGSEQALFSTVISDSGCMVRNGARTRCPKHTAVLPRPIWYQAGGVLSCMLLLHLMVQV